MNGDKLKWRLFITDKFTDCVINFESSDEEGKYQLHKVILSKNKWFRSLFEKENSNEYNIKVPFSSHTLDQIISFILPFISPYI